MKRFIKFAIVGGIGYPINLGLAYFFKETGCHYAVALLMAFIISITVNYIFNHYWTFRDIKEKNVSLFRGWGKYILISSPLDAIAYVLAIVLKETLLDSYYYGYLMAAVLGLLTISLVRYFMVAKFVWYKNAIKIG